MNFKRIFINEKKGMMDDAFDLLFTTITLFFLSFLIFSIFETDATEKDKITLERLELFQNHQRSLHFLEYPWIINEREILMKEVILQAVNDDNDDLFEEKAEEYFKKNNLDGTVIIYETAGYESGQLPLFFFSSSIPELTAAGLNVILGEGKSDAVTLPNLENKKIISITMVFLS